MIDIVASYLLPETFMYKTSIKIVKYDVLS